MDSILSFDSVEHLEAGFIAEIKKSKRVAVKNIYKKPQWKSKSVPERILNKRYRMFI